LSTQSADRNLGAEAKEAMGEATLYSGEANHSATALTLFSDATEIFRATHNNRGLALALLNKGLALNQLAAFDEASKVENEALQLLTALRDDDGAARARAALGLDWVVKGEPDKAKAQYDNALSTFQIIGDLDNQAVVFNSVALLTSLLGDHEGALAYYLKAEATFTKLGDVVGQLAAMSDAAREYWALHDYKKAESLYRAKFQFARDHAYPRWQAAALVDLAQVYNFEGQLELAKKFYLKARKLSQEIGHAFVENDSLIGLAELATKEQEYAEGLGYLREALEMKFAAEYGERAARIYFDYGALFQQQRRLDEALRNSRKAIDFIESERMRVSDFNSRATYFASVHDYYQLYIHVLMELDKEHQDQGFAEQAFDASERSKVRSLLDMLASSQANPNCNKPAEPLKTTAGETEVSVIDAHCRPAPSALGLLEVQNEIRGDDSVLLEYALGEQASYLWAVDQDHIAAYSLLGSTEIQRLANEYRGALMARQPIAGETAEHYADRVMRADHEIGAISQELAKLILAPASDYLRGKKRVIIVPEGPLQYLPFAALPFTDNQPLAANYEVITLPSFSILKALRDARGKRPPPSQVAAVFADPVFNKDDERVAQSLATARHPASIMLATALRDVPFGSNNIPRLRGSRKEAEDVVNAFSNQHVFEALDFEASRNTVLSSDLRQYRYLHFATHGVLDTAHPEFSGLILSLVNSKGEPEDGYLRLRDIYNLKLSADLVVLSSCNSALGKDLQSEGIIGLPRAFLYAGAERVISTLWKVDDQATAAFMQHFYSHIRAQENPASALRLAQSDMADDPRWHNPYYWAGFILQGEYR
jgi:CHAT domain-containing protein